MADQQEHIPQGAVEYQPDSLAIEMQPIPGGARWTLRLLALLFVLAVIWSCVATLDKVVVAQGKLVSTAKTIVVQPLSAGVITRIHVEEGQEVQAGQVLVTLDPTMAMADVEGLRERLTSLTQEAARLSAEMGRETRELMNAEDAGELQSRILAARSQEYEQRLIGYQQKIEELGAKVSTKRGQLLQARKQLELSRDMESMFEQAIESGAASRLELIKAQSQRVQSEDAVQRLTNELEEMRQEAGRLEAERDAFISNWASTATQKLVETEREIESIRSQLEKAEHISDFVQLKAPRHAVVLQLATRSEGSVVNKAEPVVTLTPLDGPLEAEVNIQAKDIGFVRPGDAARIKLEAFPFQKHGVLEGSVKVISEDAFQKDTDLGAVVTYRSRVALGEVDLRNVPEDFRLIPGMTLTSEIKVGERKVISYFLYPIMRSLDESMREP